MPTYCKPVTPLGQVPILGAKRFRIWSSNVQAYFIIDVCEPSPLLKRSGPSPLLLVTDGNLCFSSATSISKALALEPDGPPSMTVVGIGYDVAGAGENAEHHTIRNRDLTPCQDKRFEAMMQKAPAPFTWREDIKPGGSERFLSFIKDELTPWLMSQFNIDPTDHTLAGTSLGGLFALNTLMTQPTAFERYIAISPAIWWANNYLMDLAQGFEIPRTDRPITLYMAVGEREERQDPNAKMVTNLTKFAKRLKERKLRALNFKTEILPDETHMSVFSPALGRGLRSTFAPQSRDESWANLDVVETP
ncbi:Ferri-bacillibactin esterase BesA [Pseudovibrio axinellae]|uniref:Ferri-bacillibactin esterase BesA n=1 Tax=Pseudovibrio axinellae TaxID=989403 RepID=A0A165TWU3_9HYPH|nr:alpha/beta hydrolase-fold protein [Pseudovibrio axinellae]KZL06738.1 Ferri-bacillibactin esterase BesA [Pseudovibrio axinellae]SER62442.1 hypothetical protein SAMN05421798_11463 [Pseudovibrio axinellae]